MCCDGTGKVFSEEHVKQFEQQLNKYHHHYYGPQIPGILEYQRVYNKFTPTPLMPPEVNGGIFQLGKHPGKNQWLPKSSSNGGGSVIQNGSINNPRFELPEALKNKILKILGLVK